MAASSGLSESRLLELRGDAFADDLELDFARMRHWSEAEAEAFFESGGAAVPATVLDPSDECVFLSPWNWAFAAGLACTATPGSCLRLAWTGAAGPVSLSVDTSALAQPFMALAYAIDGGGLSAAGVFECRAAGRGALRLTRTFSPTSTKWDRGRIGIFGEELRKRWWRRRQFSAHFRKSS